jgi:flavoprotein
MIVPQNKKQDILHYVHDIPSAGHLGVYKALEKLKTGLCWPNMKEYVEKYCRSCDRCFAQKPKKETTRNIYLRRTCGKGSCRYIWTTSTYKVRE